MLIVIKEKFVPVQIDQNLCLHCERCLRACKNKAIYFENSIRLVNYTKCRGCLNCIQVCPRNAIEVTSVYPKKVLSVKIDPEKCNMCLNCVNDNKDFCPKNLYYVDKIKKNGQMEDGIKFNYKEIVNCQGCLKCESSCPKNAIKIIKYDI